MTRWTDRVALITGASSGIGRATAETLAAAGMRVGLVARRRDRIDALAAKIGERALPIEADLRETASIPKIFDAVREAFGGVDVLVNNAGLGHLAPLLSGDPERWREMLDVNVLALSVCTKEAIADMRRRDVDGHVIHISSMASHRVPPSSGMYSASKYAVRALTEAVRQELRAIDSPIRITAISPGFVETEFAEKYHRRPEAAAESYGRYKVLEDGDIADAVAYVLNAPAHMQVHDMLIRPTDQPS